MPSPFLFYKYGAQIRKGSTFAPCIVSPSSYLECGRFSMLYLQDLRIAEEMHLEKNVTDV